MLDVQKKYCGWQACQPGKASHPGCKTGGASAIPIKKRPRQAAKPPRRALRTLAA
jgi:hypothetical protein